MSGAVSSGDQATDSSAVLPPSPVASSPAVTRRTSSESIRTSGAPERSASSTVKVSGPAGVIRTRASLAPRPYRATDPKENGSGAGPSAVSTAAA